MRCSTIFPNSRLLLTTALLGLTAVQPVLAAASSTPSGGVFTAGVGVIQSTGNTLTINQSTLRGVINWNNFSIGPNGVVICNNGSGATLNRVTGNTPSAILGQLLASGNVYILNPSGILIGNGATIHTGGDFLASTLNLSNNAFLSNGSLLFSGLSSAGVINLGQIASSGGNVYLIGHSVANSGSIASPSGTTGLAAGSQVLISDSATGQHVLVQAPGGDVTTSGFIRAAQVEIKSNGGNIYALAGNNGGQINATGTTTKDGHVWLISTNGAANVSGVISATNANGTGGQVETSGAAVNTSGGQIRTGRGGSWLLDPNDITIDATLAGTIDSSLNGGTDVIEQTTASGTGGTGVITVASPIAWTGSASLTLSAYTNIVLNAGIANTGSGNLTLRADNTGTGTGTISGAGVIDFSASTGNVALLYNPSSYASPTSYAANFGAVHSGWSAPPDGSVSSQYTAYMLVNSAANLQNMDANDAGVYALGQNIDLSSIPNFAPLGSTSPYFTGIFDGMGHTISNLTINSSAADIGLFSTIAGQVRNLSLTNANITATGSYQEVGAIAANLFAGGSISNVSASGVITAPVVGYYIGGLVGQSVGPIQNSSSSVNVNAIASTTRYLTIGGLVGVNGGNISNSHATGSVNAPNAAASYLGGLAGYSYSSTISNSYATGPVTGGMSASVGGLAGYSSSPISNSHATGAATGGNDAEVGGLVGYSSAAITISYATGNVTAGTSASVGGLAGYSSSPISNSYATGAATGGDDAEVGGLAGYSSEAITNSYATGNVTAGNYSSAGAYAGGLVGLSGASGGTISASNATGAVSIGSGTATYAGGLVGSSGDAINNSYATGTVSGAGLYAGGLVGSDNTGSPITSSYATGPVASSGTDAYIGGLAGISHSAINSSHASGAVSSTSYYGWLGGLIGYATAGSVSSSYATGSVTATGSSTYVAGGLVGYSSVGITNSYATGAVSAAIDSDYVGGLVGWTDGAVSGSHATGSVTGGAYTLVGGLAGGNSTTISNSYASGAVTGGDGAQVGGLVGYAYGPISLSYAIGSATGGASSEVGGLAGYTAFPVANTYAHGQVTGGAGSMVGGLIGQLDSGASLATSYSSGLVSATGSMVGGLVGNNTSGATISSSYWDNQASGFSTIGVGSGNASGVAGLTTAQLQSGSLPGGFSPSIWTAPASVYPYFGWQGALVTISGTAYNGSSVIASATVDALAAGSSLGSVTTNSNGFYTFSEPGNMVPAGAGVLTYLASNGTANAFSDGANGFTGMNLYNGTLSLISGNSANLSGIAAALNSALGGNSGSKFLFTVPNGQLSLKSGANLSLASSAASLTIDQPLTTSGNVLINSSGALSIAASNSLTVGAGDNITLVSGAAFTNNDGASALNVSGGGNWLVYSQNPANDTLGGLTPSFKQYNATYGVTAPAQSGDGLLYTLAPVITVSLTGTTSKTYDGTTAATLSAGNFSTSGTIQGDTVSLANPTAVTYASPNAGSAIGVTASGLSVASASNGDIPVYGYQVAAGPATGNIGTITPATLTYTAISGTRTYGAANPTFSGTVTGFVDGQTLASATTGTANFTSSATATSNVGTYAINGAGLTADNGNYTFVQAGVNSSALTITPATLTYTATPTSQAYGNGNNAFSGVVSGFVNGQTLASATSGTASFNSATTATSAAGSYAIDGSGLTANQGNYVFTQAPSNATALTITPAASPTPTPTPAPTVLTFVIGNTSGLQNSQPIFTAAYTGPAISGVNIPAILSGLTFTVTPSPISGPGTYIITAAGAAPNGYALDIAPATLTIVASSPQALPSQVPITPPVVPFLLPQGSGNSATGLLQPPNSVGLFQIDVTSTGNSNSFGASFIGFGTQAAPLAHNSFFGTDAKKDTYAAGAKP